MCSRARPGPHGPGAAQDGIRAVIDLVQRVLPGALPHQVQGVLVPLAHADAPQSPRGGLHPEVTGLPDGVWPEGAVPEVLCQVTTLPMPMRSPALTYDDIFTIFDCRLYSLFDMFTACWANLIFQRHVWFVFGRCPSREEKKSCNLPKKNPHTKVDAGWLYFPIFIHKFGRK